MRRRKTADLDDDALLDLVQRQTLRYFWDFAHPVCGLARERSNVTPKYGLEAVTTGGSGFGVMAIIVGVSRGWIGRAEAVERLLDHGALPAQGRQLPRHLAALPERRHRQDDPLQPQGRRRRPRRDLLPHRRACSAPASISTARTRPRRRLRAAINWLWEEAEWSWHTQGGRNVLYWHWSPNNGWSMNHEIRGWNECLITYVLAASAPRYPISPEVYHRGWADGRDFTQRAQLRRHHAAARARTAAARCSSPTTPSSASIRAASSDRYADYWQQNVAHTLINRAHCVRNPQRLQGLRPRLLGPDRERQHPTATTRTPRPTTSGSSRRPRRSRPFPTRPEQSMRGAPALLPRPRRPHLGRVRLHRRLQRDRRLVRRARTSRSTRGRSS